MSREMAKNLPRARIGILGGTGLYEIGGVKVIEEIELKTPFGSPSDAFIIGDFGDKKVAFLSRHSQGHRILPGEINYRANIYGFKMLGVDRVISVNSVGSLKEELKPRDIVLSDQFYDRTKRKNSFFGEGIAAHIGFADPVCPGLLDILHETGKEFGLRIHKGGTYICIEGPAFSTRAESNIYRSWGCDVIGMTAATEARLCREAEICYATMSLVTDYDVWHEVEEKVSIELILENMRKNIGNAKNVIKKGVAALPAQRDEECECAGALANCILTQPDLIPQDLKEKLHFIIGKYI